MRSPFHALVFHTAKELDFLCHPHHVNKRTRLFLCFPSLPSGQCRSWERKLNAHFHACGCATGAGFALAGLLAAFGWQFWHVGWASPHWGGFMLRVFAAALLGGALGKAVGLRVARWQLQRTVRDIQRQVILTPAGGPNVNLHPMGR